MNDHSTTTPLGCTPGAAARRGAAFGTAWRRCAALLCLILLALLCPASAALATPDDLGTLQQEAARVRAQVAELDEKASIAIERYNTVRAELDAINTRLSKARYDLDKRQTQLDIAHAVYDRRMADIYKSGGISVIDILVSTESFADLETHIDYFLQINEADASSIEELEVLTSEVEQLTAQLDDDRSEVLKKEVALRGARADVEDRLAERKAILADLDDRVQELLERQEEEAADAGLDLGNLQGTPVQIALLRETSRYLGIPYVWAGATPSGGFDCSGLVMYVYAKFGVRFPHGATMQARMGKPVPLSQLQAGDLVFFGSSAFYHHVGIAVDKNRFIEAPRTGDVVKVSPLAGRNCALACRYRIRLP